MTDEPESVRVNLTDAASLTCRHIQLIAYPLDQRTLGLALSIDTTEFGTIAVHLSIRQVSALAEQCARATQVTQQEMAALMQMITDDTEEGNPQ